MSDSNSPIDWRNVQREPPEGIEFDTRLFIRVIFKDRRMYDIPVDALARDRADYYAKSDEHNGDATYDAAYAQVYAETISDSSELLDWARNNTNWSDVSSVATFVGIKGRKPSDEKREWTNAAMQIVQRTPSGVTVIEDDPARDEDDE